jgi:hypothetical protein
MIARIAGWLGGVKALPWAIGLVLLVISGLAGAWRLEAAQREAADLRAAAAQRLLATANAALADRADVIAALDRQAQAAADLQAELQPVRRAINAAPRTTACVASPVVRAGLDGLRAARAGPAAARPGPVAQPAVLPGAPAGAGDRTGR